MAKSVSEKTRRIIWERYDGLCALCNHRGEHIHHIIPRSANKKLIDEPDNLILLCSKCHSLVHSNIKYWLPYLQEIKRGNNE